jgi:hypothetical protein
VTSNRFHYRILTTNSTIDCRTITTWQHGLGDYATAAEAEAAALKWGHGGANIRIMEGDRIVDSFVVAR